MTNQTQNSNAESDTTQQDSTQDNDSVTDTDTVAQADGDTTTDDHNPSDTQEAENQQASEPESTSESTPEDQNPENETSENQNHNLRTAVNFGEGADGEDVDSFISLSEQLGLTPEQAQTAWDTLQQAQAEQEQADEALAKVYEGQLRQMWGNAYDNNYASAQQGILSAGGEDLQDILTRAGVINHPVIMQTFATIGQSHLEQGTVSSASGGMHNPFSSDTYNLTEQMRLYRENPSLAAMLEKAATSA